MSIFKKVNIVLIFIIITSWLLIYFFVKKINFKSNDNLQFGQKINILAPEELTNLVVKYCEDFNLFKRSDIMVNFFTHEEEVSKSVKNYDIIIYNENSLNLYNKHFDSSSSSFFALSNYNIFTNAVNDITNQYSDINDLFKTVDHVYLLSIDEEEFLNNILKNNQKMYNYMSENNKISFITDVKKINQYDFLKFIIIANEDKNPEDYGIFVKKVELRFNMACLPYGNAEACRLFKHFVQNKDFLNVYKYET